MNMTTEAPKANDLLPARVISSLANHIDACFTEGQQAKLPIIERMLNCERLRKGEYDPKMKTQIAQSGGQEIFMMLTDIKSRAADSWIKDVILNHNESTWSLKATVEPDLPEELKQEVTAVMTQEAAEVAAMGIPIDPQTMALREKEIEEEVRTRIQEIAEKKAENMERRIVDKLSEGRWKDSLSELVYDFTTYPAVFMKGPVLRKKKVMKWGPDYQPIVTEEVVIEVDRISPWDIFVSKSATTIQDGFLIQRHRLTRKAIKNMIGLPGANRRAITDVLQTYRLGLKTTLNGESQHAMLEGRFPSWGADGLIDALEYWGPASGMMLKEWGMNSVGGKPIDEFDEYQINAWKVAGYVILAKINPDPLDQRPYSKACFVDVPGSFWGKALPEMMEDVQTMCNAAARALANNMGIASGPQVEVSVDRLAPGENLTQMHPWKLWQTTSDRTGNGQPAIRFFQPSLNAGELLQIFQHFAKIADEVTGVPNYIYGSSNVSGAGRTSSGLAMLMENAAKGIKHAILNLDKATSEVIKRIYNHLMMFDPDKSIKGDMNIVAAGAVGAMLREQQQTARKEFMESTLNPVDAQIIGPEGRAHMLRESIKGLFTDINKIVPDPEKMKAMMLAQQQAMAQPAAAQPGQAGGAPPQGGAGPAPAAA